MNIVILAAGLGKRMYSHLPKVLHCLAGKPLLAHVIDTARLLQPTQIIIVHGHGGVAVQAAFPAADLRWVCQEPQRGTGHAVLQTLSHLDETVPTLVLYGDVPLIGAMTLQKLVQAAGHDALALLTALLDDPDGYGRVVRENGAIIRIVEHKDASPQQRTCKEINTGILLAPTLALKRWVGQLSNDNAQGEYYLTDIVAQAVREKVPVTSSTPSTPWEIIGVNSKAQLAQLERRYQIAQAHRLLEQGVTLADPARIDIRGDLQCGRDVVIDVNCIFAGAVVLGDGVQIGAHCVLRNVRIEAGTRVEPFCHLEDAALGVNNRLGPYARLRPGTSSARDVHIGNFVEIKNSQIGEQSKINHLSYIGDATLGARVNVGAGTITCNYDGANKHRTIIEDDVFIGSDSQLVAPVRIAQGATIGAGTTVTRSVPARQLSVSRANQIMIPEWPRPVKK